MNHSFKYRQLDLIHVPHMSGVMLRAEFGGGITFTWSPDSRNRISGELNRAIQSLLNLAELHKENSIEVKCGSLVYSILVRSAGITR